MSALFRDDPIEPLPSGTLRRLYGRSCERHAALRLARSDPMAWSRCLAASLGGDAPRAPYCNPRSTRRQLENGAEASLQGESVRKRDGRVRPHPETERGTRARPGNANPLLRESAGAPLFISCMCAGRTAPSLGTTSQDLGAAADVIGKTSRWPRSTKRGVGRRSQGRRGTLHDAGRRR
jgi:hypothetical protein